MTGGVVAWLYPWDLDEKANPWMADIAGSRGVTGLAVAGSYHSLFAVLPGNRSRPFIDLRESAVYFDVPASRGEGIAAFRPPGAVSFGDALDAGRTLADRWNKHMRAWLSVFHDTRMAIRYPDVAIRSLWGTPVTTSVCLRHPHVRDYALRLAEAAARRADSLVVEGVGWQSATHALHPRVDVSSRGVLDLLLSFCLCERCLPAALGVEVSRLGEGMRAAWARAADGSPVERADILAITGMASYLARREEAVTSLVGDLQSASGLPLETTIIGDRLFNGVSPAEIALLPDVSLRWLAYGQADVVYSEAREVAGGGWHIGFSVQPGLCDTEEDLRSDVDLAHQHGARSIALYAPGLVDSRRRDWIIRAAEHLDRS